MTNKEKAHLYFWPELNGKCKEGWCLHHKDPSWKTEDPERYNAWNPEDLEPMTMGEHTSLHNIGNKYGLGVNHIVSEETKKKLREANLGKKLTDETKVKIGLARLGKHCSEETKKKIGQASLGRHHSEETKQKISEAKSGENNWMYGKHHSEETKNKIRLAHLGKHCSEESKEKNRASHLGKIWWNNDTINKRAKECPGEGWVRGMIKK